MNAEEEYFIGALGDAYIDWKRSEVQFFQKNLQWLDLINNVMERIFGVRGRIFKRDVWMLRKRSKRLAAEIRRLLGEPITDGRNFVAGLFDSEGSVYLSSKSKVPVVDFTQCERGLCSLLVARQALRALGIESYLNGPYIHKHAKLPQYHLRIYGRIQCRQFRRAIPIKHEEKLARFDSFMRDCKL